MMSKRPLPLTTSNGQATNGHSQQPSLFANGQAKLNGETAVIHNGNDKPTDNDPPQPREADRSSRNGQPPVPRPRLLIG